MEKFAERKREVLIGLESVRKSLGEKIDALSKLNKEWNTESFLVRQYVCEELVKMVDNYIKHCDAFAEQIIQRIEFAEVQQLLKEDKEEEHEEEASDDSEPWE